MKRIPGILLLLVFSSADAAFIDCGGGLIYDDVHDVTWLQDANYALANSDDFDGRMSSVLADTWAADLSYYDSVRDVNWGFGHAGTRRNSQTQESSTVSYTKYQAARSYFENVVASEQE